MNQRLVLIVLALFLGRLSLPALAHAPPPDPRFVHLTTADGLSHDIVYCILQDRYGFMWFGTHDGLSRYDGYAFTVYHHRRSDPASLAHNTVNTLYEDRAGTLWVGTVDGLDSFTGNGGFVHHTAIPPNRSARSIRTPTVSSGSARLAAACFATTCPPGRRKHIGTTRPTRTA